MADKKNIGRKEKKSSKGLKAFFLYVYFVLFIIFSALAVKSVLIIKDNKYNGKNINIYVSMNHKPFLIFGIDEERDSASVIDLRESDLQHGSIARDLGILIDAEINLPSDTYDLNPKSILSSILLNPGEVDTSLTVFDIIRLLASGSLNYDQKNVKKISEDTNFSKYDDLVSDYFSDSNLIQEGITIQIINATDESGLGQKLERMLVNSGCVVISVKSQNKRSDKSTIKYYSSENYTVKKLEKTLQVIAEKSLSESIAEIVIIIGDDVKSKDII